MQPSLVYNVEVSRPISSSSRLHKLSPWGSTLRLGSAAPDRNHALQVLENSGYKDM